MANRYFRNQFLLQFEASTVALYAKVTFGSSGAPTLDTANSKGIASVVRNSAGLYTITLQDSYNKLLGVERTQIAASTPAAPASYIVSQAVSSATPTIVLQYNSTGTPTDPASGEIVLMKINLGNSSV